MTDIQQTQTLTPTKVITVYGMSEPLPIALARIVREFGTDYRLISVVVFGDWFDFILVRRDWA